MEILNQVILAGNLTDQPIVSDAGGRQFIRARLAQSWFYETQGKTVEHRQFIPLTFFGESTIAAKSFQKGDNIHVTGQLIRRDTRPRPEEVNSGREPATIYEIHVIRAFRIATSSKADENRTHQNEIRRVNDAKRVPSFLEESIRDWPV
jgi:single-stranded DNA-binding protein